MIYDATISFSVTLYFDAIRGVVEQAHRTHTEEFYEVTESSFALSELKNKLLEWEGVYNTVRPHQALCYVTPLKFLEQR